MKAMTPLEVEAFATTLPTSCNSDGEGPSIVGTWLQASGATEEFTNHVSDGIATDIIDANNFIRITFNADGTFDDLKSYSYTENGDVIVGTSTDVGTYSVNGNLLSVAYDGEDTQTVEFTLNGTRLTIAHIEEFTENGDQKRLVILTTYNRQ